MQARSTRLPAPAGTSAWQFAGEPPRPDLGARPRKLLRRWKRRCADLAVKTRELAKRCRTDGSARALHDLRVAARRLRLYVRVGRRLLGRKVGKELRRWARAAAQVTGPLRDYDVTLEWLQQKPQSGQIANWLQARRNGLWLRRTNRIGPFPAGVIKGIARVKATRKSARRLAKQLAKREAKLRRRVGKHLPRFFELAPADQHQFRRLVRWWRYLRELALSKAEADADELLKRLIRLQEALGERQNLAIAASILGKVKPTASTAELRRLLVRQGLAWELKTKQALAALE